MKSQWRVTICIAGLQILNTSLFGGLIYCQTLLIGGLEHNSLKRPELIWTIFFMAAYVLSEILENYIRESVYAIYCTEISSRAAKAFLSEDMYHHAVKKEEQYISFFSNEISAVLQQNLYLRLYVQKQIIMFCLSLIMLFVVAKGYGLAVILASALFGTVIYLLSRKLQDRQCGLQDKKAAFVERLMELYHGFGEIHINQMETLAAQDFIQANSDAEQTQYRYKLSLGRLEALGVGQNMIMYILILIAGGLLAQKGMAGIGVFVSAAELSVQALNEWTSITRLYTLVRGSGQLKKELDTYINTSGTTYRQKLAAAGELLLDVRGLSFCYDENAPLLDNIDLAICKGEKYLIVGESGSGKSTLLELLAGHKSCNKGKLHLYTDKIAYIPQIPFLFAGTLKENLIFDRQVDERAVKRLMEKAGLDLSLDMEIKADGENLSGGQKARVALVRALLTEPELLIADEITANLDSRLGKQIEELLLDGYPQMALCVAAHKVYCREKYTSVKSVHGMFMLAGAGRGV